MNHSAFGRLKRAGTAAVTLLAFSFCIAQEAAAQEAMRAPANPPYPATAPQTATASTYQESSTLAEALFGKGNAADKAYDDLQAWKAKYHLPFSLGANHWFHLDRDERIYGNGYGVPGERGTYYYYAGFDPVFKVGDGTVKEFGAHVQFRFRDDDDRLRPFYSDIYWFYEAYAFAKTDYGTFKAGQLVTQFGIPWDGTWWESVPYFDGYKFDPDYGLSWERSWRRSDRFSVDAIAQFFFVSDGVNGSINGADAESGLGLSERNTGVLRLVPTWKLTEDLKIAWGVSGLVGGIKGSEASQIPGADDIRYAFGSDVTFTYKNLSIFAEYIDAFGTTNQRRYVSGGPSDRVDSLRGGVSYKYGPVTFHVNYSYGWDHRPAGHQYIFAPGLNIQVTKNVVIYAEYVKWDVTDRFGNTAKFDDGFELIAVWNL